MPSPGLAPLPVVLEPALKFVQALMQVEVFRPRLAAELRAAPINLGRSSVCGWSCSASMLIPCWTASLTWRTAEKVIER